MNIPAAALQQHIAVLGKTGSGKTFAVKGIVESLLEDGRHVAIVDPTGAWWGLRSSRDGKGPGYSVLVLGGDHGDLPLLPHGGAVVARLIVERNINLIADTSALTVGERTQWFIDFAGTLSRLNRQPLFLVLDEAHNFAPQGKIHDPAAGKMLHAANTLASGGRSRGIRLVMITQRPQKLHKDTLTSADTLIAMRVLAPHDRAAVEDWIKGCGDLKAGAVVLNSLASLQRGEGWVWYPEGQFLERMKFPPITTFDSSATPVDGTSAPAPKGAATIDLAVIRDAMAEAVREAEENDPKLLRDRVRHLEGILAKPRDLAVDVEALQREFDRGAIAVREAAQPLAQYIREFRDATIHQISVISLMLAKVLAPGGDANLIVGSIDSMDLAMGSQPVLLPQPIKREQPLFRTPAQPRPQLDRKAGNGDQKMPPAERKFLIVLAQQRRALTRNQIAVFAGYSSKSGHIDNTLGALRSKGYVVGSHASVSITTAGLGALGRYEALPTGRALREYWVGQLDKAQGAFLNALADVYPKTLTRDQLATKAGYNVTSGHVDNTIGGLRTRDLIVGDRHALRLSENLA